MKDGHAKLLKLLNLSSFNVEISDLLSHPVFVDLLIFMLFSTGSHIAMRLQELLYY